MKCGFHFPNFPFLFLFSLSLVPFPKISIKFVSTVLLTLFSTIKYRSICLTLTSLSLLFFSFYSTPFLFLLQTSSHRPISKSYYLNNTFFIILSQTITSMPFLLIAYLFLQTLSFLHFLPFLFHFIYFYKFYNNLI